MKPNTFGDRFCVTSFGESHGTGLGCVIDGCPAGLVWKDEILKNNLERRRPGSLDIVTARNEKEIPEVISGVFEGKTLGTPIAILVRNSDQKSADYSEIKKKPRAGHADDMWKNKFGFSDHRGGGRSSGRETVARVMAGSVAQMLINHVSPKTSVFAWIESIGEMASDSETVHSLIKSKKRIQVENSEIFRFYGPKKYEVIQMLKQAKEKGESYGAVLRVIIQNPPPYLGEPVFRKFKSDLAMTMMSVGATCGFDFGEGFNSTTSPGTEFHGKKIPKTKSVDPYGGIRGGITTGDDILFRVAVKPTSSILDVAKKGRHDPCLGIRALPVFESMAYLVLADQYLLAKSNRL